LARRRYAIVGGTGGIGRAIESQITARGGEVICLARRTSPISLDLRDSASIEQAFEKIAQQFGPLDGLINSAGYLSVASLDRLSLEEINQLLDVNLKGLILCCQSALLKKGAHVINIASSSFSRGRADTAIYSSAKAGVVNFTQGWAEERPDLHIHAVIPQRTNTPMRQQNFPNEDAAALLDPQEVARIVVDLLAQNDLTGLLVEVRKN
jgi:ribitol-5-phosphate 2-dehydrogenase (NADP+) / D-ribitol-5-phosphate cytidylyltransferase